MAGFDLPVMNKSWSGNWLTFGVVSTAGTGFVLYGLDQGILSGVINEASYNFYIAYNIAIDVEFRSFPDIIEQPRFISQFPETKNTLIQSLVVAIFELGAFFGSVFATFYGDALGRRKQILLGAILVLIGAALQGCAFHLPELLAGRVVGGLIHLLGKPAVGDLKRPFKQGGMFGASMDPETDAKAVKDAEKNATSAGSAGNKKDE